MGRGSLPPGFRFHPTDEELVGYYLKRQVDGLGFELEVIPLIDLYKFDPWELPDKSFLPKREMEWFFFCLRDRKYPNGYRTNRATSSGYWKATGKDREIVCQSSITGYRKTLVFYCGRAPLGDRTDWVMYEYRLCDEIPQGSQGSQGAFALCRVIKKNENSAKASNSDREMLSKRVSSSSSLVEAAALNDLSAVSHTVSSINDNSQNSSPYDTAAMAESLLTSIANNSSSLCLPQALILDSSKDYSQGQCIVSQYDPQYKLSSPPMNHSHQYDHCDLSFTSTYPSFIGDVDILEDLSRIGCMSPFTGHESYTRFCGYEDIACEGFGWFEQAPLCRQASGDGSPGEIGNLWMQEDNLRIVM